MTASNLSFAPLPNGLCRGRESRGGMRKDEKEEEEEEEEEAAPRIHAECHLTRPGCEDRCVRVVVKNPRGVIDVISPSFSSCLALFHQSNRASPQRGGIL